MTEEKRINLDAAIANGERKKQILKVELEKIAAKEEKLKTQRASLQKKIAQLDHFILTTQAAMEQKPE